MNISPDLLQSIMQLAANQNVDLSAFGLGNISQNSNNTTRSPVTQDTLTRSQNPSANSKANGGNRTPINTTPNSKSNPFNAQNQNFKKTFTQVGNVNSQAFGNSNFNTRPQANKPSFQSKKEFDQDNNFMNNNNQDAITVLMVAEKPSIARSISDALSPGRFRSRKGVSQFCQVHEWFGDFFGEKAQFKVTSVTGHIYVADFPQEYQDWRTVDPQTLFEAPTIKKQANPASNIIEHLQTEAQDASYLILWLDNDREGENICFEVVDNVKDHLRKMNIDNILRVKFSSLVKEDLIYAFKNINSGPNLNESRSVDARQIIDLKIGVAFSRFQTRYLLRRYPDLNTKLVTFGPCQTPTLSFCVQRDDEIKAFTSKVFYKVVPTVIHQSGTKCELTWANERSLQIEEVQAVKNDLERIREFIVTEVINKDTTRGRPEALNTPQMLKTSSSQLSLGPQTTMQIAEKLYQQGYITYPRTESTSYPAKFDFTAVLEKLYEIQHLSNYCEKLSQRLIPPKHGKDAGDHPPITPTGKIPNRSNLNQDEWKLYEFISRHFLATISPDAKMTNMQVSFQAGSHKFHLKGTRLLDPGFTEITPWVKVYGSEIPEFFQQQKLMLNSVEVKTGKTTPPEHLTESELINLMEKHGIGTDASMAQHIHNICERNYVKVTGNSRKLVPTELGGALVHGYQQIDEDLISPNLRSQIEQRVCMIAKGEADYDQVLEEVLTLFAEKFINFRQNIGNMDAIFSEVFGTFQDALSKAIPYSTCGQCQQNLLFVEKYNKLQCENCKFTLSLPMTGTLAVAGDNFCPLDGFQLLLFTSFNKITSYLICPMCSNKSPYPEVSQRLTCNLCPQDECPYSSVNNNMGTCNACNKGLLVLDQMIENNLTASCNQCTNKLLLVENLHQFQRSTNKCDQCSAYLFTEIELKDGRPPQENVCIFCHPEFSSSVKQIEEEKKEKSVDRRPLEDVRNFENRNQRNNQDSSLLKGSKKIFKPDRGDMNNGRPNNFQRKNREGFEGRNQNRGFEGRNQNRGFGGRNQNREQSFDGRNQNRDFGGKNQNQGFRRNQSQGFDRKPNQGFGRNQNQNFNRKFNGQQNRENPSYDSML